MTLKTVIGEVCAFVGVRPPSSTVMVLPTQDRTMWEMVQLANEMAQRIAYETRDWRALKTSMAYTGDGAAANFPLPANYRRMLSTSNVWRSTSAQHPMRFIADTDEWYQRRLLGYDDPYGEWMLLVDHMYIAPILGVGVTATYVYLDKNCINLASGGNSDRFAGDDDTFRLDERLLKLGMIWQWKAYKGGTYAEDIANYEDALAMVAGADKPSPIIIGRTPMSGRVAYPYPTPNAPETPYP